MKPRWSRDGRVLLAIGAFLGLALTGIYALVLRARALTPGAATNRVLLFVLFYIVVVLILALLFVLVRSAVKLVLEARRGVFGSRFRVRVVVAHVGLALLPIALLVLPTTGLLQRSVDLWFEPPVAETVRAGRSVADLVRERGAERERRVCERLAGPLAADASPASALALLSAAREESGLDYIEWRSLGPGRQPVAVSSPRWPIRDVEDVGPELASEARLRGFARRIESIPGGGQVSRTVAALPGGLLIAGAYDPPEEAEPIRALSRATSTYAMLEAERGSLKATQVLLFLLLALLVLLAAVWVGLVLARRVTLPIAALAESARRVGAGDFGAVVAVEGNDEIAGLGRAFNTMTEELRTSRGLLVSANAELAEANRKIDDERQRIRTILTHLGAGVLAFGNPLATPDGSAEPPAPLGPAGSTLLAVNETARRLLGRGNDEAEAPDLCTLLSPGWLGPLRDFLCRAFDPAGPRETTLNLVPPESGEAIVLDVRVVGVAREAGARTSWVVTLEDTTALVKAERAAAWEEAARRMAHEIKNPLTPIRLAAERMRRRARRETGEEPEEALRTVVEEGATTIVEEVGTLAALVDAFQRFARLPEAQLAPCDLAAVVGQVVKLYAGTKPGVRVVSEVGGELPPVRADAEQVKRALINLVDNAVAATPRGGTVTVDARVEDGHARLVVADDGPGIPEAARARVFDASYSTKPRGSGLGLAITARIAAEHAGRVSVEENEPRGCRFVFEWPAA